MTEGYSLGVKLHQLAKSFKWNIKEECTKNGLNPTFFLVIMHLAKNKDGVVQSDIVNHTRLKAPTISLTLKQIEALGYITRTPSKKDSRKVIVKLTDTGFAIVLQYQECFRRVEERLMKDISKDDLDLIYKLFDKLERNLKREEGDNIA